MTEDEMRKINEEQKKFLKEEETELLKGPFFGMGKGL